MVNKKYHHVRKVGRKKGDAWEARVTISGRQHYVGVYPTEKSAAEAADNFLITVLGPEEVLAQRRPLNFPRQWQVKFNAKGVPFLVKKTGHQMPPEAGGVTW